MSRHPDYKLAAFFFHPFDSLLSTTSLAEFLERYSLEKSSKHLLDLPSFANIALAARLHGVLASCAQLQYDFQPR
jgi:hypothetical protein